MIEFTITHFPQTDLLGTWEYHINTLILGGENSKIPDLKEAPAICLFIENGKLFLQTSTYFFINKIRFQGKKMIQTKDEIVIGNLQLTINQFAVSEVITLKNILNHRYNEIEAKKENEFISILQKLI